ncbi:hypothetical protein [Aggregatilinea lenta]|uniref:hypothetical protein n=1 Tax=Aggregatilinea lenta TaxID=913108 RepID=UPI000E5B5D14|nr:hypothetical protein [Aggregatilinea lenta]
MNEYAPNRRSSLRDTMTDDQWALANEDALADPGLDLEDFAAGYVDEGLPPLPRSTRSVARAHMPHLSRRESIEQDRIPRPLHEQRHWEVEPWNPQLENQHSPRRVPSQPRHAVPKSQAGSNIPLWAILLLVILALFAALASALAIAFVASML